MIGFQLISTLRDLPRTAAWLANRSLTRFLAVGTAGLATDMLVFTALHEGGLSTAVARAGSLAVATLATWSLNRHFTFAETGRLKRFEISRYFAVVLLAQGFSYVSFLAIAHLTPGMPPQFALFVGAVLATGFSFCGQRFFTFAALRRAMPVPPLEIAS